jgi:hypothetical protein
MDEQHGMEPAADLANLCSLEAVGQHCLQSVSIPMTIAQAAGCQWHKRILYPRRQPALCTDVFQEQQRAAWLEHATDLAQASHGVAYRTEDKGRDCAIETGIGERKGLDRRRGQA